MATVPTQVRIDENLKKQATELFSQLGMDMSSAMNIFLKQCVMRGGLPFEVVVPQYKQEVLEAMEEAKRICDFSGENTYIKIPVTVDGIKAIKNLHKKGYKLTGTAIFTPQQAMLAACAGADFVAPYINRLDNISTNGIEIAENIHKMLSDAGLDTEVLAASFSNVEQIHMTAMHGVTALTISPALFDKMLYHPLTINAVHEFIANGSKYYNI